MPADDIDAFVAFVINEASVLTPRQRQVIAGVLQGRMNSEIADELGIQTSTVGIHLTLAMREIAPPTEGLRRSPRWWHRASCAFGYRLGQENGYKRGYEDAAAGRPSSPHSRQIIGHPPA